MRVEANENVLTQIRQKRGQLEKSLASDRPRKRRLINTTIVGGTVAAALTAATALGGAPFTAWLTNALGLMSPSWRILCGGAFVCSVASTVATQLLKSQNLEENVSRAQGCRAKLEMLEVGLSTGQLDVQQSTSEYLKCIEDTPFLEGT